MGAPLAIVLASKGLHVIAHDVDASALAELAAGRLPFMEVGGDALLKQALAAGTLSFAADPAAVAGVPVLIVTIGTPIDEFHNPRLEVVVRCLERLRPHMSDGQTVILRSTVFPGVTEYVSRHFERHGPSVGVAFCPERVVQGRAIEELENLPQIVSGVTPEAEETAAGIFSRVAKKIVRMGTKEAEFAKLIANSYRYIQFAAANQFYMMVEAAGLDYGHVLAGLKEEYPRLRDLPGPGFAAGPCLMKDTMQLVAFDTNRFSLGSAAMMVNEGLPNFLVDRLRQRHQLSTKRVGILGMAFKADIDDVRDSLSYKLAKILRFEGATVLCSDEFAKDDSFVPADALVAASDIVIVAVPHSAYRTLRVPRSVEVIDLWGILAQDRSPAVDQPALV